MVEGFLPPKLPRGGNEAGIVRRGVEQGSGQILRFAHP